MKRASTAAVAALVLGLGLAAPAQAQYRQIRPGTVSLGLGGSFGLVTGNSRFGLDFDSGGGYLFALNYAVTPNISLGLNFQNQTYNWVDGEPRYDNLVVTTFEGHARLYRKRGTDASQYVMAGIGVYRPEFRIGDTETVFPGDGFLFTGGAGVELFLRENWALDLSARGIGYVGNGISDQEFETVEDTGNLSFGLHGQLAIVYFMLK
jgi:opacity protein-like surface antigen